MKGEFHHTVDSKGRLFIPAKLRDEIGQSFVVTKGLDNCLFVYSADAWSGLEEKICALPLSKARALQRFFFSSAVDCEADGQGRFLIPAPLRRFAGIETEAVIIGVSGRIEIWSAAGWAEYNDELSADQVALAMEELGF